MHMMHAKHHEQLNCMSLTETKKMSNVRQTCGDRLFSVFTIPVLAVIVHLFILRQTRTMLPIGAAELLRTVLVPILTRAETTPYTCMQ